MTCGHARVVRKGAAGGAQPVEVCREPGVAAAPRLQFPRAESMSASFSARSRARYIRRRVRDDRVRDTRAGIADPDLGARPSSQSVADYPSDLGICGIMFLKIRSRDILFVRPPMRSNRRRHAIAETLSAHVTPAAGEPIRRTREGGFAGRRGRDRAARSRSDVARRRAVS